MKKTVFLAFLLLITAAAAAQEQETYLYAQRDTCSLFLDVYRPAEGAETTLEGAPKPTVVFIFGGGFIMGRRDDPFHAPWFKRLTDNGYTVVSIDYRLGMKGYQVGKGLKGALKASERFLLAQQIGVEDLFSAVAFLTQNREQLGIDPDNLVVSGSSAGAIITLAAVHEVACGRTGILPKDFRFKGAMSFAGGIVSTSGAPDFPSAPCPILLLHGTADEAVAYDKLAGMGKGLWGSNFLAGKLSKAGYPFCIYRFKDRTHAVAAYMDYVWDIEQAFLEQNVILGHARSVDAVVDDPSLPSWFNVSLDDIYRKR